MTIFLLEDDCLLPVCGRGALPEAVHLAADPSVVWLSHPHCDKWVANTIP